MGAQVGNSKGGAKSEINITPLVDVVLVLLIIFMVVSPGDSTYVPDAIPQPAELDSSRVITNEQMVLELFADGKALLNQKEIRADLFTETLKELFQMRSDKKIFIAVEDELPYGEVVAWMGLAKSAGATLTAIKLGS